ncbi:group I truncated hemoglobin [Gilvimarinus agarilyticus]|uniref:group I truncated hemoglobin n=1 Tax=Gilvimarinus agarilyticus TaxID=679259 RepID=UPI0005A1FFE9|nr:group 1 truncated hemoglobin [Gilvimarinus agarilyticus]
MKHLSVLCFVVMLIGTVACAPRSPEPTLYDRLGGPQGVDAIVYQLLVNISQDDRVIDRFDGVDIEKFRVGFAQYICSVSHGGCVYSGDNMQQIHAGHDYTATEFNAIVSNLIDAMEHEKIPTRTQNQLLKRLASSYDDVVYR